MQGSSRLASNSAVKGALIAKYTDYKLSGKRKLKKICFQTTCLFWPLIQKNVTSRIVLQGQDQGKKVLYYLFRALLNFILFEFQIG